MTTIAIFSSKGGVGKTSTAFQLANAFAKIHNKKTLLVDLCPQADLTSKMMPFEDWKKMLEFEEPFINNFQAALLKAGVTQEYLFNNHHFSIHGLLKPLEDGVLNDFYACKPIATSSGFDFIPSSPTLQKFETKISENWDCIAAGLPNGTAFLFAIRNVINKIKQAHGYDYVVLDLPPNLGLMNKSILGTAATGFIIPLGVDSYSAFALHNMANTFKKWHTEFTMLKDLDVLRDKPNQVEFTLNPLGFAFPFQYERGFTLQELEKYDISSTLENLNALRPECDKCHSALSIKRLCEPKKTADIASELVSENPVCQ